MNFLESLKSEICELNEMTNAQLHAKEYNCDTKKDENGKLVDIPGTGEFLGAKFDVVNLLVPVKELDPKELKQYETIKRVSEGGRKAGEVQEFARLPVTPDQSFEAKDKVYVHCDRCDGLFISRFDYLSYFPECPICNKYKKIGNKVMVEPPDVYNPETKKMEKKPKVTKSQREYHKDKAITKKKEANLGVLPPQLQRANYVKQVRELPKEATAIFDIINKITDFNTEKLNNQDITFLNNFLFTSGFEAAGAETSFNLDALFIPIEEQAVELYQQEHNSIINMDWNKDPVYINENGIPKIKRPYKLSSIAGQFSTMIVNGQIKYEAAFDEMADIY
jgi:hypothetical protein